MKKGLHRSFLRILLVLFSVLGLVWIAFYALASTAVLTENSLRIEQTAQELLEDLGQSIELMEQLSFNASSLSQMKELLSEPDIATRHALAEGVYRRLQADLFSAHRRFSLVVMDADGWFYRFSGGITGVEAERLVLLSETLAYPSHLTLTLGGKRYIGHANEVRDKGNVLGVVFVIENEENLFEYSYDNVDEYIISTAVFSGEDLVLTNGDVTGGLPETLISRQVGLTPFQVVAWQNPDFEQPIDVFFLLGVLVFAALAVLALWWFVREQRRRFFQPLDRIMQEVDGIDFNELQRLSLLGNADFDGLVAKINALLSRLQTQNKAVSDSLVLIERSKAEGQAAITLALKKQINAHFIVNTLGAIQMLSRHNEIKKSEGALSDLSAIVRYAFDESDVISVWDEMMHIRKYVNLMNVRYHNKIALQIDADDSLMETLLPRMMLQPIVENSIAHGFRAMRKDCILQVSAGQDGERIYLTVRDNGVGMTKQKRRELNAALPQDFTALGLDGLDGMGIVNVKRRLTSLCKNASFIVKSDDEGTETQISFEKI